MIPYFFFCTDSKSNMKFKKYVEVAKLPHAGAFRRGMLSHAHALTHAQRRSEV